ncbi:hypothetical protein [Bradyrhizobium sp. AUGA SZCCT0431]|uniref:hypothetical protein n=1 Tax=Bradyrhizobium sp. AUGA SZCCT0431 TaxID=2807674 RepID=UPI001BA457F8|nr:hypothetical protein [Bradyrhizobium sp. AUGA SZCCT0431]MBR1147646.1 hypothetical protein [Bradyrhizobium sp. AUGA SZCCT0431]
MIKSISAFAIFALLEASVIALPGFAPVVKADEAVGFAETGQLASPPVAGNCVNQVWPNIASSCLRDTGSGAAVHEARLVTAPR